MMTNGYRHYDDDNKLCSGCKCLVEVDEAETGWDKDGGVVGVVDQEGHQGGAIEHVVREVSQDAGYRQGQSNL